jgi:hypothetical protein
LVAKRTIVYIHHIPRDLLSPTFNVVIQPTIFPPFCSRFFGTSVEAVAAFQTLILAARQHVGRISSRLSHVREINSLFVLSPKVAANLSTHSTISCANRSAVAFASTVVCREIKFQYNISTATAEIAYRSQFHEVGQGFNETTDRDRAIRYKLEEILMSTDRRTSAAQNLIESIFWVCFIPDFNFAEDILIENPSLP